MTNKVKPTGTMRVRAYLVISRAVEDGVELGWRRAHKHTDAPSEDTIREAIAAAVLGEICEWFDFDDPESETP
jgi:hypothetical protein